MPTALELGREGWKHYVEAAKRKSAAFPGLTPGERHAGEQLLDRIRAAATALKRGLSGATG